MKPTIGSIVHFYDSDLTGLDAKEDGTRSVDLNHQGSGPYAAVVIQAVPRGFVSLLVHAWGGDWREGAVPEKMETTGGRYWEWPRPA